MAGAEAPVRVRWLGVAGFSFEADGHVVLHDPYLSRPGLWTTLFSRYRPDPAVLEPLLDPGGPAPELRRAGTVLVGHSHFDHLGDVPWLAGRSGALVLGTATTANLAAGTGLPEGRARVVAPGDELEAGPFAVRVVESRHAPVLFGRVPLPGSVDVPPGGPLHAFSYKMGGALGFLLTHRPSGLRIYVLSSAGVHAPALEALAAEGLRVDALLAATQGRSEGYADVLVRTLRPAVVVPHHFDDFFRALDHAEAAAPSDPDDLAAFEAEVRDAAERHGVALTLQRPALFEPLWLLPAP